MSLMILPVAFWSGLAGASPRLRAVRGGPDLSRILWIGAHPDDETLIAPLLGRACVDGSASCTLLVATRGENGECGLPAGCSPDLGTVRSMEMQSAAALLHARLIQWSLPDVMQSVETAWPRDALVRQIADVIESERSTIVITFDPNHGSSCHPAHRFLGSIVVEATELVPNRPPAYFVETFYAVENGGFVFRNAVVAAPTVTTFDATSTWHFLAEDVRTHQSQFTPAQADALEQLPPEQKRVYLMPATASAAAQYDAICP